MDSQPTMGKFTNYALRRVQDDWISQMVLFRQMWNEASACMSGSDSKLRWKGCEDR